MARKVIIDCDPGISDATALCMSLFDPRLDVLAVTATAGTVTAQQASRNVHSLVEYFDPPRRPRTGIAMGYEPSSAGDSAPSHSDDGLGNLGLPVTDLHRQHAADKLIIDTVRANPGEVTIITMGPLTNVASSLNREPELASLIHRIVITGGSVNGIGNVTPAAEFNLHCHPLAARVVFRSMATKTLIPLELGQQVVWDLGFINDLPDSSTRAGRILHKMIPHEFRVFRQEYGLEGIQLYDVVAIAAVLHPEFFEMTEMAGDVEVSGDLTSGATIFDRRPRPQWRKNMEVATNLDVRAVTDAIVQGLRYAGQESR
jgi:purine nucleosidase